MILLKTDRGILKVNSYDEITELAGYRAKIDPSTERFNEVIGSYKFKEKIHCGLTSCNQPHNKGYIISTQSGLVFTMGKDCGKTHFGLDFDYSSKRFDRQAEEYEYRENIASFISNLETKRLIIDNLRKEKGADEAYKKLQLIKEFNGGCPEKIVQTVLDMIRKQNNSILVPRQLSEEEVSIKEELEKKKFPRPYYEDIEAGKLKGLESLFPDNDLRSILMIDLSSGLKELEAFDYEGASHSELSEKAKWCDEFDNKIQRAEEILSIGIKFLDRENLSQLECILDSTEDHKKFNSCLNKLEIQNDRT